MTESQSIGGPYVTSIIFCERILIEQDGTRTLVRIVDFVSEQMNVTPLVDGQHRRSFLESPFQTGLYLSVSLSPDKQGSHELSIQFVYDDGSASPPIVQRIEFANATDGLNIQVRLVSPFPKSGRLWAEVKVDGVLKNRASLDLRRTIENLSG